ncbi:MAG: aminotransferase class III-fold pyridoxal phosphate-dependent enzyme, partial [Actinomycetota bacterium]
VVHHGGATKLYDVQPDIVCLAKALGGGVPCGAIGGTAEVMSVISDGRYSQVGTFNGNPLTMAAAKAVLVDVLKPSVYAEANELGAYILNNALDTLRRHGQPAYGFQAGFKVCVVFSDHRAKNYREFLNISTGVSHLHFLKQFNGGIFLPPWGKSESLTLSVAHTKGDADIYIENLVEFGQMLGSMGERDSKVFAVGSFN